jgi:hypothetical protein
MQSLDQALDLIDLNGRIAQQYFDDKLDGDTEMADELKERLPSIIRTIVLSDMVRERKHRIIEEGFTIEHDDQHTEGELSIASACYAVAGIDGVSVKAGKMATHPAWPWDEQWDKREQHDAYRRKIIAAALLLSEAERMKREEIKNLINDH